MLDLERGRSASRGTERDVGFPQSRTRERSALTLERARQIDHRQDLDPIAAGGADDELPVELRDVLMSQIPHIRRYQPGEEPALFEVYYSAIHLIAVRDYTLEQVQAWAPRELDSELWANRIRGINPFVAELKGELVGYADLQQNGYIDYFFVSGKHGRRGIGSLLMRRLLDEAGLIGASELTTDASRTAQPFFARFGFTIAEQRYPKCRGVVIPNALMRRRQ